MGNIINEPGNNFVIPSVPIDPPMLSLTVTLNDSPLKGNDGDKLTEDQIRERVERKSQDDVSLRIEKSINKEFVTMHGRGDLHLGVLIEKMRREGFEMSITPPQVIMREDSDTGKMLEPYEQVVIDTDLDHLSGIIDKMNEREGVLLDVVEQKDGR